MTDPLPDELKRLFDAERAAPGPHAATRAGIKLKLMASISKAALGASAKTIVMLVLVVGAVSGGTIALVWRHATEPTHITAAPAPHARANEPVDGSAAPVVAAGTVVAAPITAAPIAAAPIAAAPNPAAPIAAPAIATHDRRARVSAPVPTADVDSPRPIEPVLAEPVPAEPELLRDAWSAISVGNATRALELVRIDEREHPSAVLAEERAVVEIVALAKLDRLRDAHAAATAFAVRYPDSVHRDLVENALDSADRVTKPARSPQ